jgi:hypothetical protein
MQISVRLLRRSHFRSVDVRYNGALKAWDWSAVMIVNMRLSCVAVALLSCAASSEANAITVEVARACEAAMAKAFPPRQIGNPAAGSAKGSAKDQREYFNKCVANNGKPDDASADSKPGK